MAKNLQKKLADAIDLLRKDHPLIDQTFPSSTFGQDILDNFPEKLRQIDPQKLQYLKVLWIILGLSQQDPSILTDENSQFLREIAQQCEKKVSALMMDLDENKQLQEKLINAVNRLRKDHPLIDQTFPSSALERNNIFNSFPEKFSQIDTQELKYLKVLWII